MKKLMMAAMMAAAMAATADDYSFTYQAELKDEKGAALESRNQTVEIRLWKTATTSESGDLLWGRTYNIYTDENGLFNQEVSDALGSRTGDDPGQKLSDIFCENGAGTVYLGLKVKDSSGEIVPRQRLFAVPFAGRANSANNLVGTTHNVNGTLQLDKAGSSLSSSGLVLPASSVSTVGNLTAESVTCKGGDLSVANVSFTGQLTGADSKEIIPVPIGGVIMWTQKTPPDGQWDSTGKSSGGHWAICNGYNQTPNLCGRFVVGVGSVTDGEKNTVKYELNDNSGGLNKHKLTTDEMPSHRHSYLSDQLLRLSARDTNNRQPWESAMIDDIDKKPNVKFSFDGTQGGTYGQEFGTSATGGGAAHENRPPFYALYYIMRVK